MSELIVDLDGNISTGPEPFDQAAERAREAATLAASVAGILSADRWTVPADGTEPALVTFGTSATVHFVVDGVVHPVEPADGVATLEVTADGEGPIVVNVQDKSLTIVAV